MSWILTAVSIAFIAWAWGIEWGYLRIGGGGEGADAMGRGLAVAFLGLIGIVLAVVAFVVALFTQQGIAARLVPLTPFLLLLGIWVQSRMWHASVSRQADERPRPWLVVDPDPARRAAVAGRLRALDHRYVVTEIDGLNAVAGLDKTSLESLTGMVIVAGELAGIDPDDNAAERTSLLKRIDPMASTFVIGPDAASVEDARSVMTRRGTLVVRGIESVDPETIGEQLRFFLVR